MNRRSFLTGLIASSTAAVAAHFGAPEWMGEDIKKELARDLRKTVVSVPSTPFENRPVWMSMGPTARVWTDYIMNQYQIDPRFKDDVNGATRRMAKAIDFDLSVAKVEKDKHKVIIETPLVRNFSKSDAGRPYFELVAGLESKDTLFGDTFRVGYINGGRIELAKPSSTYRSRVILDTR